MLGPERNSRGEIPMPHRSNGFNYRAVDKAGHPVDFLLTTHRDRAAALRFLATANRRHGVPETITSAGSGANAAALRRSKPEARSAIGVRQVRHRDHRVEQDQRAGKRLIRSGDGPAPPRRHCAPAQAHQRATGDRGGGTAAHPGPPAPLVSPGPPRTVRSPRSASTPGRAPSQFGRGLRPPDG
jgi:hypothetical protein